MAVYVLVVHRMVVYRTAVYMIAACMMAVCICWQYSLVVYGYETTLGAPAPVNGRQYVWVYGYTGSVRVCGCTSLQACGSPTGLWVCGCLGIQVCVCGIPAPANVCNAWVNGSI